MLMPRYVFKLCCVCLGLLPHLVGAQNNPAPTAPAPGLSHPLGTAPNKPGKPPGRGDKKGENTAASNTYKEVLWDDLIPASWNPLKEFQDMNLGMLKDGDPKATALLKRMREVWDQAPINEKMDGALVRLPGYVVPLEDSKDGMKEFLLVPYFGACIHTPPPPANQIIHVQLSQPVRGLRSMEAVWIQGPLQAFRYDSLMGVSGYRMQAQAVELFVDKGDKKTR